MLVYRTQRAMPSPLGDLAALRRRMDDMAGALLGWGESAAGSDVMWTPPMNVREDENSYHVELELPGVSPDQVELSVENNVLRVSGEKQEVRSEGESVHVYERCYGRFERELTLGRDVDPETIQAGFDNGVLGITLPKREQAKPRRIEIKAGSGHQVASAKSA